MTLWKEFRAILRESDIALEKLDSEYTTNIEFTKKGDTELDLALSAK